MVNRVVLVGNLTKAIDLQKSDTGVSYARFTIAVSNRSKESNGERGTMFLDCRIFGAQAETMFQNTRKGSKIAVDGSLNQRNFERKDGSKGKAIEVIVDSVTFLDSNSNKKGGEEEVVSDPASFDEPIDEPSVDSNVDINGFPDNDLPF